MTVHVGEVKSAVDAQAAPAPAPAAAVAPADPDREARLHRELAMRAARDRARTRAEGYDD